VTLTGVVSSLATTPGHTYTFRGMLFDPREPIDMSVRPCPPKPTCPLPDGLVARLAERFGVVEGEEVIDCGGYLLSHLGGFGQLHPFEAELVAQGCVVLNEMGVVLQPQEAMLAYYEFVDRRSASHGTVDTANKVSNSDGPKS
jgi:hypothetical protein